MTGYFFRAASLDATGAFLYYLNVAVKCVHRMVSCSFSREVPMSRQDGKMAAMNAEGYQQLKRKEWMKSFPMRVLAALGKALLFVLKPIGLFIAGITVVALHVLYLVAAVAAAPTVHALTVRKAYRCIAVCAEVLGYGAVLACLAPLMPGVPPVVDEYVGGYELYAMFAGIGLLATNTVSSICEVGRRAFRPAELADEGGSRMARTGPYPICVNEETPLADLAVGACYDILDAQIVRAYSGEMCTERTGVTPEEVELFHYAEAMTTEEVLRDVAQRGYRSAALRELITFNMEYRGELLRHPIVALGSVVRSSDKQEFVPYSDGVDGKRQLRLRVLAGGWDKRCRFAVVKRLS